MTADPEYRVIYNNLVPLGTHSLAHEVLMLQGQAVVTSLHVLRCAAIPEGPEALQGMSTDEQIRFALANPRVTLLLMPAHMQRQMISLDARMIPASTVPLRPQQPFAIVRILEANGRLLDMEVVSATNDGARAMAIRVVQQMSFSVPTRRAQEFAFRGTVVMAEP